MRINRMPIHQMLAAIAVSWFCQCVYAESTPTYTIPDGGTFNVRGTFQTGSYATNACGPEITVLVKALGDATIKVSRPTGASSGALYFTPVATNGTLTLDLTDWDGCDFRLDGGIVTHPGGTLVVKGRDSLAVGFTRYDVRAGFGDRSSTAQRNTSRPVAFGDVAFVAADGTDYASPGGITLSGAFYDAGISTSTICPWTVAEGAVVSIDGQYGFIARYSTAEKIDVDSFDLWVLHPAALAGIATVCVSSGRNVRIVPRRVQSYDSRHYGWDGLGASSSVFTNDVELLGVGATLTFSQHYTMTYSGNVSGTGMVRVALEHQNSAGLYTDVTGLLDYAGPLEMALAGAATNYTLKLNRPTDLSDNPVALSTGAILDLNYAAVETSIALFSNTVWNAAQPAGAVRMAAGLQRLRVGQTGESASFAGFSSFSNSVEIGSVALGGVVIDDARVRMAPSLVSQEYVRLLNPRGNILYRLQSGTNLVHLARLPLSTEGEYCLDASDGLSYANPPENVRIEATNGVSASVLIGTNTAFLVAKGTGSLLIGRVPGDNWRDHVMLWLDPSQTDSWRYWTYNGEGGYDDSGTYKAVGPWGDWRESGGGYYLITDKHYTSTGNRISPFIVPDGLNGLPYMSFLYDSSRRRMLFYPVGVTNNVSSTGGQVEISPKFAVMVFGSQQGGGQALFGNASQYYKRGGTLALRMGAENPIFSNSAIPTWVDGESVDPAVRGLDGGWEIISVDTSAASITGLGLLSDKNNSSGMGCQNYAEVMFFDKVLSDEERIAAERYLANKWGLADQYRNPENAVQARVFGNGALALATDAELGGAFAGNVAVNGHILSFVAASLPPTEDEVASIAGRVAWFDPDDESRINYGNYGAVARMFDKDVDMSATSGARCLDGVSRNPMPVVGARGCGPSRRWLDYSAALSSSTYGKALRLQRYGITSQYGVDAVTARTVFMVQDSSKGGGTPFMSTVNDTGTQLSPRLTTCAAMPPDHTLPIWRDKSAVTFADGTTYLDGRAVNGALQGFNGRPELLTAIGGMDFPFGATGYCQYMEGVPVDVRPDAGEVHGEMIVYGCELPASDRQVVEGYLMNKWLGTVNAGYGVYTNMTLLGSGTVSFTSTTQMPKFSAGFDGTVTVSTNAFTFTLARGYNSPVGVLDFGGAVVSLPAVCTLNVVCRSTPYPGVYRLISSSGLSSPVAWTLNLTSESGAMRNRACRLVSSGGNVDIVVDPAGAMIVVR